MAEAAREAQMNAAEMVSFSVANFCKFVYDFQSLKSSATGHLSLYAKQILVRGYRS
jgi:hypothetical protein